MIKSKSDYKYYLEADRIAKGYPKNPNIKERIVMIIFPDHVRKFQVLLRKLEYSINCKKGFYSKVTRVFLYRKISRLSLRLGFTIPPNVFGPGLSIAHYGTLLVSVGARVGANCRLHTGVSIATEAGHAIKAPTIGKNCYIGPGVKFYGDITLADGIVIGANAVVNKSFLEPNIAIAGVPAKKIGKFDSTEILIAATDLLESGYDLEELSGLTTKQIKDKISKMSE